MLYPALFSIVVGVLMLGQWAFFLVSGNVPELKTTPWSIGFHLAAEFSTALMLIVSGWGLLAGWGAAQTLYLIAVGMLVYAVVNSAGYFAQQGTWVLVGMFGVIFILLWIAVWMLARGVA